MEKASDSRQKQSPIRMMESPSGPTYGEST